MMRSWQQIAGWIVVLIAGAAFAWLRHPTGVVPSTSTRVPVPAAGAPPAASDATRDQSHVASLPGAARSAGFRTRELLTEHYRKHGREFGAVSMDEYLALARALRDRPAGGGVLEATRVDGVVTRFDRASGAFLAFNHDGTIRTFFRPNQGEVYFQRQRSRPAPKEDRWRTRR